MQYPEIQHHEMEPLSKAYEDQKVNDRSVVVAIQQKQTWGTRFSGWRGGILVVVGTTSIVLLLNVVLAIVAASKWELERGIATIFTGNCKRVGTLTTVLHFLINVLSSFLLGASNFCMQRLVAPSRKELDAAHAKKKWLDIGMPSIRNLAYVSKWRVALWLLLGLSSLPLHFL
jgi:hypothetical protein